MKRFARLRDLVQRWRDLVAAHSFIVHLLIAFVAFRVLAVLLLLPGGYVDREGSPDMWLYQGIGALAAAGRYPYLHYWLEYPPIIPWTAAGAYLLSMQVPAWFDARLWLNAFLRGVAIPFDAGSLLLVYLIVRALYGQQKGQSAAMLYAVLFAPLFVLLASMEALQTFFLLLSIYGVVRGWPVLAGTAIGVGLGVKMFTVTVIPAAVRVFSQPRRLLLLAASVVVCLILIFGPFLIASPDYTLAFFRSLASRDSWQSTWAVLDGYHGVGRVAPLALRNDPHSVEWTPPDTTASRLPWLWITLGFGALGLFLYTRRIDWQDPVRSTAFTGLTLGILLLYSKGYSPGWSNFLLVMAILLLPGLRGLIYGLLYSFILALDWPILVQLLPRLPDGLTILVFSRAILTIALCIDFAALIFDGYRPLETVRRFALPTVTAGAAILAISQIKPAYDAYVAIRLAYEPIAPVLGALRGEGSAAPVIVLQPDVLLRTQPYLPEGSVHLVPDVFLDVGQSITWVEPETWLDEALDGEGRAWLVFDNRDEGRRALYSEMRAWFDTHGCPISQAWYDVYWAGHYALAPAPDPTPSDARFEQGVALSTATLPDAPLRPGDAFCVRLTWTADAPLAVDHTAFVHILAPDGALVAQSDVWPDSPASTWQPGEPVTTTHGIWLPGTLSPGTYLMRAGLYTLGDAVRLPALDGGDSAELGRVTVE